MAEIKIQVGEKVKIYSAKTAGLNLSQPGPGAGSTEGGAAPPDDKAPGLLAPKRQIITFYDLGTRYNPSTKLYEHLRYVLPGTTSSPLQRNPIYNALMLGGNPTDSTTDSDTGKKKSNCIKLPEKSQWLYIDFALVQTDQTKNKYWVIGENKKRALLKNLPNDGDIFVPDPEDDTEGHWSERGLSLGGQTGKMRIESASIYYSAFDLSNPTAYKVTDSPDSSATQVELDVTRGTVKVYLTPTFYDGGFIPGPPYQGLNNRGRQRFPVLPDFEPQSEERIESLRVFNILPEPIATRDRGSIFGGITKPLLVAIETEWQGDYGAFKFEGNIVTLVESGEPTWSRAVPTAPALAAIIVKNGAKHYVWDMGLRVPLRYTLATLGALSL